MKHTIGNHTIYYDGWGKDKDLKTGYFFSDDKINLNNRITTLFKEYNIDCPVPVTKMYGQDAMCVLTTPNIFIIANADGHGGSYPLKTEGYEFPFYSVLFSIVEIHKSINHIKNIYKNKEEISNYMNNIFQKIDNYLMYEFPITKSYKTGGTTLTINIKFVNKNGKLVSITTNAGDSLMVTVNKKSITEKTFELNCDTLESYNKYIDKCNEIKIKPLQVILGRFNSHRKSFKVNWVHDSIKPIEPFKLKIREDGTFYAEENTDDMKLFYDKAPLYFKHDYFEKGGIQSIRDMPSSKKKYKQGGYPSSNYGNTAEGIFQCLPGSSIGDKTQKHRKDMMLTHTSVHIYNDTKTEIIGSDGFFDTLIDNNIIRIRNENENMREFINKLIINMFKNVENYEWPKNWDDISMLTTHVIISKNKKKNKFKTKRENRKKRKNINKYN